MNSIVGEAKTDAAAAVQRADEAARRAEEATREHDELQALLGATEGDLYGALQRLQASVETELDAHHAPQSGVQAVSRVTTQAPRKPCGPHAQSQHLAAHTRGRRGTVGREDRHVAKAAPRPMKGPEGGQTTPKPSAGFCGRPQRTAVPPATGAEEDLRLFQEGEVHFETTPCRDRVPPAEAPSRPIRSTSRSPSPKQWNVCPQGGKTQCIGWPMARTTWPISDRRPSGV